MDNQTMLERFEEAFLAGRSRDNALFASLLHRGADGDYFNANTAMAFAWFVKGAASVNDELLAALEDIRDDYRNGQSLNFSALTDAIDKAKAVKS